MNSHVHPLFASALNSVANASLLPPDYRVRKFADGWWSICRYAHDGQWGQFRGPFSTEAAAEMDCANVVGRFASRKLTLAEPGSPGADYLTRYYERADRLGINTGD